MRACWLKWVGRDWSISADYIWLNYSGANNSEVDTQIAAAIDEHLRAIDRLCRFGIDGGFGEEHPVKEY